MALLYQIPVDPLSCKAIFPSKTGNSSTLAVNPVLPLQARLFALFFATASLWFRPFLLSLRGRIFVSEAVSPFCSDKRVSLRASFVRLAKQSQRFLAASRLRNDRWGVSLRGRLFVSEAASTTGLLRAFAPRNDRSKESLRARRFACEAVLFPVVLRLLRRFAPRNTVTMKKGSSQRQTKRVIASSSLRLRSNLMGLLRLQRRRKRPSGCFGASPLATTGEKSLRARRFVCEAVLLFRIWDCFASLAMFCVQSQVPWRAKLLFRS